MPLSSVDSTTYTKNYSMPLPSVDSTPDTYNYSLRFAKYGGWILPSRHTVHLWSANHGFCHCCRFAKYGDWFPPHGSPSASKPLASASSFIHDARVVAEMAGAVGTVLVLNANRRSGDLVKLLDSTPALIKLSIHSTCDLIPQARIHGRPFPFYRCLVTCVAPLKAIVPSKPS
jgi:hypothetical protein